MLTGALGLVFSYTPVGQLLEEEYGLSWLFQLRGPVNPPSEVIIVSINRESSTKLDLPDEPEKWPRSFHGRLITELKAKGVLLTVFNIIFDESRESTDSIMADAMGQANNVILTDYLKRRTHIIQDENGVEIQRIHQDELIPPIPILSQAAIVSAPFLLPKGEINVKRFLPFGSVESLATLPVTVLQTNVVLLCGDNFLKIIQTALPMFAQPLSELYRDIFRSQNIHQLIYALQASIEQDEHVAVKLFEIVQQAKIPEYQKRLMEALFKVYLRGQESRYLNHYGPPKTIVTVPYHKAVSGNQLENINFKNKIVFVGFSEDIQPERYQGFFTVFTQNQRKNVSSVELAATAFANLLHDKTIRELSVSKESLIVFFWGLIIGLFCRVFPVTATIMVLTILGGSYLVFSLWQFSTQNIWFPLTTPLALQIPFAILTGAFYRYITNIREKRNIQTNLARYLPKEIVDAAGEQNPNNVSGNQQLKYGVCLATDAGQYTALAESLDPLVLGELMNKYYSAIFSPVEEYNGYVSDVIGDAMLAIWSSADDDPKIRRNACHAALGVRQISADFSRAQGYKLVTRIGLHYGQMLIGNVGAVNRMEYRAVGDTVNTASRIEGLNKTLGTHLLASKDVIEFLDDFYTRELGIFLLAGKNRPLVIHEIICRKNDLDKDAEALCGQFANALSLFKENKLDDAMEMFHHLVQIYPNDGPCAFYQEKTAKFQLSPPDDTWGGIIRVGKIG